MSSRCSDCHVWPSTATIRSMKLPEPGCVVVTLGKRKCGRRFDLIFIGEAWPAVAIPIMKETGRDPQTLKNCPRSQPPRLVSAPLSRTAAEDIDRAPKVRLTFRRGGGRPWTRTPCALCSACGVALQPEGLKQLSVSLPLHYAPSGDMCAILSWRRQRGRLSAPWHSVV